MVVLSFQNAFLLRMKPSVSRFIEILNVFKYPDKLQFFMYNHEYLNPMRHDDKLSNDLTKYILGYILEGLCMTKYAYIFVAKTYKLWHKCCHCLRNISERKEIDKESKKCCTLNIDHKRFLSLIKLCC